MLSMILVQKKSAGARSNRTRNKRDPVYFTAVLQSFLQLFKYMLKILHRIIVTNLHVTSQVVLLFEGFKISYVLIIKHGTHFSDGSRYTLFFGNFYRNCERWLREPLPSPWIDHCILCLIIIFLHQVHSTIPALRRTPSNL